MVKDEDKARVALGIATSAGLVQLFFLAGGVGLGYVVDMYLPFAPWGLLFGGLLGGVVGLYCMIKRLMLLA